MGHPCGEHEIPPLWVYSRAGNSLEMVFGFYHNFTPDDLICKVIPAGEYPLKGEGASLQFNGDLCTEHVSDAIVLQHSGRITVRSAIKRDDLLASVERDNKNIMQNAGFTGVWPVRIGSTAAIPALLDRLFLYTYCIEQAKRSFRGKPMLSTINNS